MERRHMETRRVGNECVKEKLSRLSIHPSILLSNLCYCFPSHRKYWKSILSLGLIPLHPRGLSRCVVSLCSCGPFEFFLLKNVLFVMIKQKCFTAVLPAFPFSTWIQSHGRVKFRVATIEPILCWLFQLGQIQSHQWKHCYWWSTIHPT